MYARSTPKVDCNAKLKNYCLHSRAPVRSRTRETTELHLKLIGGIRETASRGAASIQLAYFHGNETAIIVRNYITRGIAEPI